MRCLGAAIGHLPKIKKGPPWGQGLHTRSFEHAPYPPMPVIIAMEILPARAAPRPVRRVKMERVSPSMFGVILRLRRPGGKWAIIGLKPLGRRLDGNDAGRPL